ncbi:aminoglycoside phosphotransferase family protein [Aetokthonos hydrillicola Thurmond2011]|jgi:thiamine kinase-like enzyme|uniref:Aminoglycoside phosphotransferase family protein n=1 Tax=Aetokthonos hydrillicola Thurmond2011 TaxID=2712845 RepID=A0AAP5MA39_9CYAN|nr:aminoglycoside phosphotransferase family protein [Aetokthonos hydrillicola]MBO3458176.1 aminoglycoside phosphotransferase family protein [Aetokthonos hydrillicola CCALA 1050]MBW4584396.1 aminoglycoside phosphotransferase family protein [Aetokthonos hydrillicola CCALA 1050]MDR9896357.1 aminoglycoside phosphotransferase family protein [Aetokthonos hydrillicola Thurmond2011]
MVFSISSDNVTKYLQENGLISSNKSLLGNAELPSNSKKNFNLVVSVSENQKLLVKQERCIENEVNPQEFFNEWLFEQLLQRFPVLGNISELIPLVAHFDEENSIIVRNYLTEYVDLADFYQNTLYFPKAIAIAIGTTLGMLHRTTFNHQEYRKFMATPPQGQFRYQVYNPAQGIGSIGPETFGLIPTDALKFYTLYQCYASLEAAIAELSNEWKPCCLTHNDLKFHNILVHSKWDQLDNCLVRFIDWEACAWGDPAFDLGTLIANYLEIWLDSLVIDPIIELEESLHLAATPLEVLQPSILALIQAYLNAFSSILEYRPDFCLQAIQFAGLVLIHQTQEMIEHRRYFNNAAICKLQLAKKLLTKPEDSVLTVFGVSESEIIKPFAKVTHRQHQEKKQNLLRLYYDNTRLRGC